MRRPALPLRFITLEDRLAPATLTVNSLLDTVVSDSVLTLREAVNAVNAQSTSGLSATEKSQISGSFGNSDTIQFASSLNGGTIQLNGTQRLNLQRSVTIQGPGADKLTIDGGKDIGLTKGTQIFFIDGRTIGGNAAVISGLHLTNGFARAGTGTTTNGKDNSIRGGAIYNDNAVLTVNNCYFSNNQASFGGAVQNFDNTTTLQNSAFYNNVGSINGGAINNASGSTIMLQCTVNFNRSEGVTGAVTNNSGTMQVLRSTITGNNTVNPSQGNYAAAGVFTVGGANTILIGSVVADNFRNTLTRADLNSSDGTNAVSVNASSVNNFVSHPQSAGGMPITPGFGNILGNGSGGTADANLSLLQMNGGTVPTQVPRSGSPLIGKGGTNTDSTLTDARGFQRQAQDNGTPDVNATIDIGATERINKSFTIEVNENSGFIAGERDTNFANAIRIANENLGTQTIDFSPTVFATPQTVTLGTNFNAEFAINEALVINGPAARLTIDAQGKGRIFNTSGAPTKAGITLNNLTLTGGSTTGDGGAIFANDELVQPLNCTIINNQARHGGAICFGNGNGVLDLGTSTISGNTASGNGGGIYFFNGGTAAVYASSIINNKATGQGGGFYFYGATTAVYFRNCTISGNSAGTNGGGITLPALSGTVELRNCTVTNNTAAGSGGGVSRSGLGSGILDVQSTIISGNVNSTAADIFSNTSVNANFSVIGSSAGFTLSGSSGNNLPFGTNLLLGPLQNNGGPTLTHQPASISPVKNKGSNPENLTNDARGNGFPRSAAGGVDIGAVEAVPPSPTTFTVTNANDAGAGSLRQAILDANANSGVADKIVFSSFFATPRTIALTSGAMTINDSITLSGPGAGNLTINAQGKSRVLAVNNAADVTIAGVTLTGGSASVHGGAINASGGAKLTVLDSVLTGNSALNSGGAISTYGMLTVQRSVLSSNSAGVAGGAFFSRGLMLKESSLVNNTAAQRGGAMLLNGPAVGAFDIQNSHISGNTAPGSGAIELGYVAGTYAMNSLLSIRNTTITGNSSTSGGTVQHSFGTGAIDFRNTVVFGNSAPNGAVVSGNTVTANYSLFGSLAGFTLTGSNNFPAGTDPKLGAPVDVGGGFVVQYPVGGSPLINAGDPTTTDNDIFGVPVRVRKDIGAVEFDPKVAEYEFSVGSDRGTSSQVTQYQQDLTEIQTLIPFGDTFTGGIRTASGDVTGDGVADLIVASGFAMKGTVKVFDGQNGKTIPLPETVAGGGTPFGDTFTRGIIVAAGDLNADGLSDLIITAEAGGGARVRVFQSTGSGFTQRSDFIALIDGLGVPDAVRFRGGSRATASDINGDGINDLIWAAGAGGGPRIATFNGALLDNSSNFNGFKMTGDFFAFGDTSLRDGCFLAGGDINGDGVGDIVFGGGSGAPPIVVAQSGADLVTNINASKGNAATLQSKAFFNTTFGVNSKQGIRVSLKDLNFDNIADLILGSSPGAGSRVTAFDGINLSGSTTGPAIFDFTAVSGFNGGVFVG